MDQDSSVHQDAGSQQEQAYEVNQEDGSQQQIDDGEMKQPMTVSVSQLQQQVERDPRYGGPPLYEQEYRAR